MPQTGLLFLNDRDVATDFSIAVSSMNDWPGGITMASRAAPLIEGSEMPGAILDPRTLRRQSATATVKGILQAASPSAAMVAVDALRELLTLGDVRVRTAYAPDRECLAVCTDFGGDQQVKGVIDGNANLSLSFIVRDGTARRLTPDGYALTTGRTSCPVGTAESRPVIVVHGGGASLTNPTVTMRNAAGEIVQTMSWTVVLGATAALRIDCARMTASVITAGVVTDALAANYWTSGDFSVLRLWDAMPSLGAYATVELSASAGTPVGDITYRRRYA